MKRLFLLIFCVMCFQSFQAVGSHIVGGEFEIQYVLGSDYRYEIRLIIYFDSIFGQAGAKDQFITANIYRKSDDSFIRSVNLTLFEEGLVEYTVEKCRKSFIITKRLRYAMLSNGVPTSLYFSPNIYNDPQGYYIVWERCCRNYQIDNIYSQQPDPGDDHDPNAAGQAFYLEFPPVVKNGVPFINSSPLLFPPLSDYGCPNQYYYINFAGEDVDDDSLVYSIVTPMNTHQTVAIPPSGPAPFDSVRWRPGYSRTNVMMGNPDLRISSDGILTVTPTRSGLFVFGVRCIEYRDGLKIGEVRRDFQMFVLDGEECPTPKPPVIEAKPIDAPDNAFVANNIQVNYPHNVSDEDRCIQIRVSDEDSQNPNDSNTEEVRISVVPIGFKDPRVNAVLPAIKKAVLQDGSMATFDICFPECPFTGGVYKLGIIAHDDACPLPRLDTIIVTVNINIPSNAPTVFDIHQVTEIAKEGVPITPWTIRATDVNLDTIILQTPADDPYNIFDYGFTFEQTKDELGVVEGVLRWDTRCDVVDFSDRTEFEFVFIADDNDFCNYTPADTMKFDLTMDLYNFHPPTIETEISPDTVIEAKMFDLLDFDVIGKDQDNDHVRLVGHGLDFEFAEKGVSFAELSGLGHVVSPATWKLLCDKVNLDEQEEYTLQFIAIDEQNRCHYYLADTVNVTVKIAEPDNNAPELAVLGNKSIYTLGETISIDLLAADADVAPIDKLKIELIDGTGNVIPEGYTFTSDTPFGPHGKLTWTPGCEIFVNDDYSNDYKFRFRVVDDRCFNEMNSAAEVEFTINDVERNADGFLPPNFVTPNNDGKNDYFAMARRNENGELESILPNDNCTGTFVKFVVYNRWGSKVYETTDRDFKWVPGDEPVGVYFYTLKYTTFEYKGTVTLSF